MRGEPVAKAVWRKMIFWTGGFGVVQANPFRILGNHGIDTVSLESLSMLTNEKRSGLWVKLLPLGKPTFEKSSRFVVKEDDSATAFLELVSLQYDGLFNPVYVVDIHGD